MTDEPSDLLGGITPLEYADCKNLQYIINHGVTSTITLNPDGLPIDSMVCILTLLGVEPEQIPIGRGFLEALGSGVEVNPTDIIFRCNMVEVNSQDDIISSCPTALSPTIISHIINKINPKILYLGFRLIHTTGYKILLICTSMACNMKYVTTYPPHQNIGNPIKKIANTALTQLIDICNKVLLDYRQGENKFKLVPWDFSLYRELPSFESIHGKQAAIVCGATIASGIGKALAMEVVVPNGATAEIDTDLATKAKASLTLLQSHPYVVCHVNGADECSHRKDPFAKADFIRKVDETLLSQLINNLPQDTELIVCSDHCTSSTTGKHFAAPQPYITYKKDRR